MAAERREHMKASINPLEEQITDIWAPQVQVNKLNTVHYSPPSYRNREKNEGFFSGTMLLAPTQETGARSK
jgi:hypothetical protein